ncbi:MAG: cysteine--tRNA ligase [Patescibacteria group bacterium]|nr:cysteine--tRNA ligase [Patescibacteria group bacterium]
MKLYNTLTKKIEEFKPINPGHVNLYTCGPTVYNYAHIGNLRSYILADLLYRTLKYSKLNPIWVMNITDVDDKTIKGTIEKYGKNATVDNLREFTQFYLDEFKKDLDEVNVLRKEITFYRVTDVIPQIQKFIVDLVKKGLAYVAEDGIYFSIEKYQQNIGDYGELVGHKFLEGKKIGARVSVDEYEKDNLSDFVLWKAHNPETDGQIFWQDECGDNEIKIMNGRPGWHIECSVINRIGFNGEPTDIHTGGVDLVFPHHTNEIAQSQALFGKGNFVHHWFHSEHLLVDGKKMAKSAGNFYILKDLEKKIAKKIAGVSFRYLCLQTGYQEQMNFVLENFIGALHNLASIIEAQRNEDKGKTTECDLEMAQNNLNIPQLLAGMNKHLTEYKEYNQILGLDVDSDEVQYYFRPLEDWSLPEEVVNLKNQRRIAREGKNFAKSDELRKQIEDLDYEVLDTPEGQKIKRKISL